MFWMFNRKPNKPAEVTLQEFVWNAQVIKPDGYTALEWGKARYNAATDTVSLQYVTNYLDGKAETVVKNNISIAEALAEIAKLRQRENLREWICTEDNWQGVHGKALSAIQVAGSKSVIPAPKSIKSYKDVGAAVPV